MNVPHDILRTSLVDYALGQLADEDVRRLEAHLSEGCDECSTELAELRETFALLAATAPAERAPARVRDQVFGAIRAEGDPSSREGASREAPSGQPPSPGRATETRTVFRMPPWGRVSIAGLLAASVLLAVDGSRLRQERVGLRNEVVLARARIVALESEADESRKWADLVTTAEARFAQLAPTPDGDSRMSAWAIYDPTSRRAAVVVESAVAPEGRDFELWAIEDGAPRSLGVFQADASGRAVVQIDAVGGSGPVAAFAVSREPDGGSVDSTAPSGPIVLVGTLGD